MGAGGEFDVVLFEPKVPEGMTVFVPEMLVCLNVITADVRIDTSTFESELSGAVRVVLALLNLGVDICIDVVAFESKVPAVEVV